MTAASVETTIPSAEDVRRSAVRGGLFVGVRQIAVQGANVLGTVLLTRIFSTSQFGLFVILIFASKAITLLSGAALSLQAVRSPKPLSLHSLRVLFTAQSILSVVGGIALWTLAPTIAVAYHAGDADASRCAEYRRERRFQDFDVALGFGPSASTNTLSP